MPRPYLRVANMDQAYILAHRISAVAARRYPKSLQSQRQLEEQLIAEEQENTAYRVQTCWHSRFNGMIYIVDNYGSKYYVHHTDVMRV